MTLTIQKNLSFAFGIDDYNKPIIYNLIKNKVSIKDVLQNAKSDFDIILLNVMIELYKQELFHTGKEYRLKKCFCCYYIVFN